MASSLLCKARCWSGLMVTVPSPWICAAVAPCSHITRDVPRQRWSERTRHLLVSGQLGSLILDSGERFSNPICCRAGVGLVLVSRGMQADRKSGKRTCIISVEICPLGVIARYETGETWCLFSSFLQAVCSPHVCRPKQWERHLRPPYVSPPRPPAKLCKLQHATARPEPFAIEDT